MILLLDQCMCLVLSFIRYNLFEYLCILFQIQFNSPGGGGDTAMFVCDLENLRNALLVCKECETVQTLLQILSNAQSMKDIYKSWLTSSVSSLCINDRNGVPSS